MLEGGILFQIHTSILGDGNGLHYTRLAGCFGGGQTRTDAVGGQTQTDAVGKGLAQALAGRWRPGALQGDAEMAVG